MPYDRELADRIRTVLGAWDDDHPDDDLGLVDERQMFGGLAFMVAGHMAVCAGGHGDLMARVDPADLPTFCEVDGVEPMRMSGRPSRSWVNVDQGALTDAALTTWVERGVAAARSAPRR